MLIIFFSNLFVKGSTVKRHLQWSQVGTGLFFIKKV